ncbi:MAG TPA: radical SAM protein [Verrucomicrobia bacterium]|nr:radical SAM protein [Verrucomicrobiota bacterium]
MVNYFSSIDAKSKSKSNQKPIPFRNSVFNDGRYFLNQRWVYLVISPRAEGLSIGVNVNPDRYCNFDCIYCEVEGPRPKVAGPCPIHHVSTALENALRLVQENRIHEIPPFRSLPEELLQLKSVTLSGDGEPTLCPNFTELIESVIRLRAGGLFPFFKMVLITNGTGLHLNEVRKGLKYFTLTDEIWVKLDVGTQDEFIIVNRARCSLKEVIQNILLIGKKRPIVIQSLFPESNFRPIDSISINSYVQCLIKLIRNGAQIASVQIYSAHRPASDRQCGHLPLRDLSAIAREIKRETGLNTRVF